MRSLLEGERLIDDPPDLPFLQPLAHLRQVGLRLIRPKGRELAFAAAEKARGELALDHAEQVAEIRLAAHHDVQGRGRAVVVALVVEREIGAHVVDQVVERLMRAPLQGLHHAALLVIDDLVRAQRAAQRHVRRAAARHHRAPHRLGDLDAPHPRPAGSAVDEHLPSSHPAFAAAGLDVRHDALVGRQARNPHARGLQHIDPGRQLDAPVAHAPRAALGRGRELGQRAARQRVRPAHAEDQIPALQAGAVASRRGRDDAPREVDPGRGRVRRDEPPHQRDLADLVVDRVQRRRQDLDEVLVRVRRGQGGRGVEVQVRGDAAFVGGVLPGADAGRGEGWFGHVA